MGPSETTANPTVRPVRCAIYTRKSTEEGLAQEFNSLDAQRECAQAYILSQRQQGWSMLPAHYDDGGFTGAHLDRPALQRLLADIQAGRIDCVVIYKVDRLSRSLFDFARLMQIFDKHSVSFVSVTQQLNSSTPMGRLTLHILLSFAQFEREIISERTRDKQSAARRKGKWTGGCPVLGYDPDPQGGRLVVNQIEAERVRQIFALFLGHRSLMATLEEIHSRDWTMKSWTTRKGQQHVGRGFDRPALVRLLRNVIYRGEVSHQGKIYAGEQAPIVERDVWKKAQELLWNQAKGSGRRECNQGALLRDLLQCGVCGSRMVPGYTAKSGRRYPYYVCLTAQKRGAHSCPGQRIQAQRIEPAVIGALEGLASKALGVEQKGWSEWARSEPGQALATVVSGIQYDGGTKEVVLRLRAEVVGAGEGDEVRIRVEKEPVVKQERPGIERPAAAQIGGRLPRITRLLALAVRFEDLLRKGTVKDYADLARLGGVSRARMTQIMQLRNLAPAIQERILLHAPVSAAGDDVHERVLRRVAACLSWRQQMRMVAKLWPAAGDTE
jgi:DNA invertase Pin-like site-specific DNA recombinase